MKFTSSCVKVLLSISLFSAFISCQSITSVKNNSNESATSSPTTLVFKVSNEPTSFQWIRSISPDLNSSVRSQPSHAKLSSSSDGSSLYALTNSAILKTNASGEEEWIQGYWNGHEITYDQFLDGIEFDFLRVTPEGNIVVAGCATSNELSKPDAWQPTILSTQPMGGYVAYDGFVACYSPKGTLLWSTYLGGSGHDGITYLSVRSDGIYVLGGSQSPDFYARLSPKKDIVEESLSYAERIRFYFQYIMKFSFTGEMEWAEITSFGLEEIQDTPTGFLILQTTEKTTLPIVQNTAASYSQSYNSSEDTNKSETADYYITSIDFKGNVIWSTYLGGVGDEFVGTPLESPKHNVPKLLMGEKTFCVIGETTSLDYPLLNPLQDRVYTGEKPLSKVWLHTGRPPGCPVITCFSFTGEMLWSTYFGGPPLELTDACMENGKVYISGKVNEPIIPIVSSTVFDNYHQDSDGLLAQIDSDGTLLWSTYFGGDNWDTIDTLTVENGTIYFSGSTRSTIFQSEKENSKSDNMQDQESDEYFSALFVASVKPNSLNCTVRTVEVKSETFFNDPDSLLT
ncbi:MAG: hypothetical protein KAH01_01430, partial [Caldisericia bacterium]|nr:hypothetical protein [Caldisericia bacterium]